MKKNNAEFNMIIMAIVSVVVLSFQSNAQDKPLNFGAKVGISSSVFTQECQDVSGRLTGFSAGGFVTYKITDFFSVGAELLYIQQGASNLILMDSIPNRSTNLTFHTIDIPVLLFFNIPSTGEVIPKIFVGHSFGYNIYVRGRNRLQIDNNPVIITKSTSDMTSQYERLDFAAVAGIGVDFKFINMVFTVDGRYRLGYTNMFLNDFNKTSFGNVSLNVGVGF